MNMGPQTTMYIALLSGFQLVVQARSPCTIQQSLQYRPTPVWQGSWYKDEPIQMSSMIGACKRLGTFRKSSVVCMNPGTPGQRFLVLVCTSPALSVASTIVDTTSLNTHIFPPTFDFVCFIHLFRSYG
ncbi:uncharacterized protein F4822DRAFT_236674 [Hypoxylon trugodes]|uniref:uncharacterized protein n=1 Tax=Hypoxylon trugodes TaxID=326681 RepID=UPI0021A0AC3B|nr:uncharacterized protein F4822DRAFT_236674 [Hypoxylon trugodes]KAI1388172.1 hypothetical protein F4822DRAFT_236674 [Hypoxylon trugodes]